MEKKFNINNEIKVKLNDRGREIYLRHYSGKPPFLKKDDDGYCIFQMWVFMKIFGAHLIMGFDPPFETTIKIDANNLD